MLLSKKVQSFVGKYLPMEIYYSCSVLIVLSALFAFINERFFKLPSTIGIMVMALLMSLFLLLTGHFYADILGEFVKIFEQFNFSELLLDVMLGFMLFAGAIHFKISDLRRERNAILLLSSFGVVISTVVVGVLMYYLFLLFKYPVPLVQCLIFGALISPTDPVAVLSILKQSKVPSNIEVKIAGESLFNDGVAVLLFTILVQLGLGQTTDLSPGNVTILFFRETVGGGALGLLMGYLASISIKHIENYKVDVLITLAVVMGGSVVAKLLHTSGPLCMVSAGIVVGSYGKTYTMSEVSKDYLNKFWELIDEIFNAMLFLIMGFVLLFIPKLRYYLPIGLFTVFIVLLARAISIIIPAQAIHFRKQLNKATLSILIWGGLRGGVSLALALSLHERLNQKVFVSITYIVVVFSILIQGLTIGRLTDKLLGKKRKAKKKEVL